MTKGRLIYAEGRLHTRTWEGQDGQKRYRAEVVANSVVFLDKREAAPLPEEAAEEAAEEAGTAELEPEDIPF